MNSDKPVWNVRDENAVVDTIARALGSLSDGNMSRRVVVTAVGTWHVEKSWPGHASETESNTRYLEKAREYVAVYRTLKELGL